jgi:tetratricopeptide (TPR) repeat protein
MDALLKRGIAAAKAGAVEQARALLMQVVEQDEENERAWLWLSAVVESDEERRICLENVLTLNPDNAPARKGLEKLNAQRQTPGEHIVRREVAPISPAAAILHPEQQIKEWRWRDPVEVQRVSTSEIRTSSVFDDVWNSQQDLCGYCAYPVSEEDRVCPRCARNLIETQLRFPNATVELYFFAVFVMSLGFQSVVQIFIDLAAKENLIFVAFSGMMTFFLLALSLGVFARKRWAYLSELIVLGIMLALSLYRLSRLTGPGTIENQLIAVIAALLPPVQLITALAGLLVGLFRAGQNFEMADTRNVVALGADLRRADDDHYLGKQYAERGLWAMAIPYWQRAAANEPTRTHYHRLLGEAYARLGFYDRSLDILQTALRASVDPQMRSDVEQLIQRVQRAQRHES